MSETEVRVLRQQISQLVEQVRKLREAVATVKYGPTQGEPPYETLPWVADFLNRRRKIVEEMKAAAKNPPTALAGGPHVTPEKLLEWARRLEVPDDVNARPQKPVPPPSRLVKEDEYPPKREVI